MEPRRLKTFWRRTVYVVVAVVVLAGLFVVEEHIRGRIMLDRWTKQMRAQGERFTLAEALPAAPRPEDNAAPYIAPFPAGMVIPQSVPAGMRYVAPGKSVAVPRQREWFVGGQSKVQFTTNGFRASTGGGRRGAIPSTNRVPFTVCGATDLDADLATASNTLASVKHGLHRSGLDFAFDYTAGFNTPMMHLMPLRSAAQWLRAASLHALLQTNLPAALAHLQDMAALARLETNGVLLIDQLVRIAIVQITAGATWEALQVEGWNDGQLSSLQAAWGNMEFATWLARAGEVERIMGGEEIERIAEIGPDRLMNWMFTPPPPTPTPKSVDQFFDALSQFDKQIGPALFRGVYFPVWRVAWKDQDKLNLYKSCQPLIEASRLQATAPNWKAREPMLLDSETKDDDSGTRSIRFLISRLLQSSHRKTVRRAVEAEATRAMVETAIALHRWKLRHASFPEALDELVPALLAKVPIDPVDGKPLRYRVGTNAPFTLYSVGHNCIDDGGDARPESGSNPGFINGLDVVWPSPATREEIESFEWKER